jgi:hypothetical protein
MNVSNPLPRVSNLASAPAENPFVSVCTLDDLTGAYLLVGGGHHFREETIQSLIGPRQSEMK